MALQNGLFTLALSALMLAPVAAKAEDVRFGGPHDATPVGSPRVEQRYDDYRTTPPRPVVESARWHRYDGRYDGRYEVRDRGHYEQFWVERSCFDSSYGYQARCVPGHMEQRWVPGYGGRVWGPVYPGRY